MAAGGRDFERALRTRLAFHVLQVGIERLVARRRLVVTRERLAPGEVRADCEQVSRAVDRGVFHQRGLRGVLVRQHESAVRSARAE